MEKKGLNIILCLIGMFLGLISFWKQYWNYYRIILVGLGFIVFVIGFIRLFKNKISNIPLIVAFGAVLLFSLDSIVSITFSRIPIFSYNVITNGKSRVYNAVGYRVWACEGKAPKVDTLYKLGYYCDASDMEELNSNAFLGEIVDKFDSYKNKYIKINGKISRKEGIDYIEMQSYQANNISLNGYVSFSDRVTLRVIFKSGANALSKYDIYDSITVVGKIWYLRQDGDKYVVYMEDSKIVDEMNYDKYEIVVTDQKNCEIDKKILYKAADYDLYSVCLDNILVKFNENNIYEISSVLSSGKLSIGKILEKANNVITDDVSGIKLYNFEKFNIVKCSDVSGGDVIIGNKDLSIDAAYCGVSFTEDNGSV